MPGQVNLASTITSLGLMNLCSRVSTLVCVFMYPTRQPDQTPLGKPRENRALKHRDMLGIVDVYWDCPTWHAWSNEIRTGANYSAPEDYGLLVG